MKCLGCGRDRKVYVSGYCRPCTRQRIARGERTDRSIPHKTTGRMGVGRPLP